MHASLLDIAPTPHSPRQPLFVAAEQGQESTADSVQNGTTRPPLPANVLRSSPFGISDTGLRRLNFGESATDLASCPEEGNFRTSTHENNTIALSWGSATALGHRRENLDTLVGVPDLSPEGKENGVSLFALFDGHGGAEAANYARDHLASLLLEDHNFHAHPGEALNTAFLEMDLRFHEAVKDETPQFDSGYESGSTLLAALMVGNQLWVANAGDSRAIVSCKGRAEDLSEDHTPYLESEVDRVTALGAFISDDHLLGDQLGTTRSMGDYHLTTLKHKSPGKRHFSGPLTAEPAISCRTLKPDDEFIILACDGLWDNKWSSQRVVELARQHLQHNNNDPDSCAKHLVDVKVDSGASDNVTVVVICLSESAPPRRETDMKRSVSQNGINTLRSALQAINMEP